MQNTSSAVMQQRKEAGPMIWPFGDLQMFGYDFLMVDAATRFETYSQSGETKSPQAQYDTMTLAELAALPVGQLAGRDAIMFMWWTWPLLLGNPHCPGFTTAAQSPAGFLAETWGFRYSTGGAWFKRTVSGKAAFGPGYRVRTSCEPWLLFVVGNPLAPGATRARNAIEGLAREHSRKPDAAYEWAERYWPDARRVDLFSRQSRPGWDTWGREATKFDETA